MRIDPLDIVGHTIVSMPLRLILAWVVGMAGAFTPVFIGSGFEAFEVIGWQFLFFPFYLFLVPFSAGGGVPLGFRSF